ncbi:MAG: ABC transporter ATP-binding protein [Mycobacteriales bacterium]
MAALIEGQQLDKAYGDGAAQVRAPQDVSVQVQPGSFTVIAGPSGSGKTTLLHCLAGLAVPDRGRVCFAGQDLQELGDDARARLRRQRMAFVFQRDNLLPALTAAENTALPLLMRALPRAEVQQRVGAALERVGLGDRAAAFPAELSGGQLQRVAVARAICSAPDVLWADEPTGALDSAAAADVVALLRGLAADGCAVVVVSHAADVAAHADQVVRLRDGHRV